MENISARICTRKDIISFAKENMVPKNIGYAKGTEVQR